MTILDKIEQYRDKLNLLINYEENYDNIYKMSIRLDELIVQYYKFEQVKN